ncbi:SDR family oxidoreductase [Neorhizobium sp. NCHU2750]|uniref:SDR family oxidoreductase n=1 Tax=Neorhizobium sp. NCHU2750 TaxID=1825976 RepID=UPI000EB78AA8|nr:hypothetical protein NCHU2750_14250 [Neorhizobium sp. NCHU2750]
MPDRVLDGKRVLVIGGSSGIGRAVAAQAAAAGASLILIGRNADALAKAKAELASADVATHVVDATDVEALEKAMGKIGAVDHVVSMVGGAMGGGFMANSVAAVREAIDGKFFAALQIAKTVLPHVRDGGSLVMTAGAGGRPHNASGAIVGNAAIRMLAEGLAVEMAPKIRVNAVSPTWMDTPLWRNVPREQVEETKAYFDRTIPLARTANVDEVASAYLFALSNTFLTGQTLVIDGGLGLVS